MSSYGVVFPRYMEWKSAAIVSFLFLNGTHILGTNPLSFFPDIKNGSGSDRLSRDVEHLSIYICPEEFNVRKSN